MVLTTIVESYNRVSKDESFKINRNSFFLQFYRVRSPLWVSEISQRVKTLVAKSANLSFISETHVVEG